MEANLAHSKSATPLRPNHHTPPTLDRAVRSLGASTHAVADEDAYARLLHHNMCYEAMPTSNKMVVFDLNLHLGKAFNGLIYQNTRHVLLADGEQGGKIVGILSVTDFIRVMLRLHRSRLQKRKQAEEKKPDENGQPAEGQKNGVEVEDTSDLGELTIKQYRDLIASEGKTVNLVTLNADQSLLDAARTLSLHHIHRLPILDPDEGSPLFILTHKRILKFLWCFGQQFSQPDHHLKTAKELGVGSWNGIRVVFPDTPLVDCLDILLNKGVSGVPVVERNGYKVVDMYSRFDAIGIALEERADSLDVTVEQALAFKNTLKAEGATNVVSVRDTDTLWKAVTVLVERNVHRLCALDEKGCIEGVVSLSDVINYLVVRPGRSLETVNRAAHHYKKVQSGDLSDKELRSLLEDSAQNLETEAHRRI